MYIPGFYRHAEVPVAVQEAGLKDPRFREYLRDNPFLTRSTWTQLLATHEGSTVGDYLTKNLDRYKVVRILDQATNLGIDRNSFAHSDLDMQVTGMLAGSPISKTMAARIIRSEWPDANSLLLRSAGVPFETKLAAAPWAYRRNRIMWAQTAEAAAIDEDVLWDILNLPERLRTCSTGTIHDANLKEEHLLFGAVLLQLRPGLKDRAIESQDPMWLLTASYTELSPSQQARMVEVCSEHWKGPITKELLSLQDRKSYYGGSQAKDPLTHIASSPWCTEETWAALAGTEDEHSTQWVARTQDGLLMWGSSSQRYFSLIRNWVKQPPTDLRTETDQAILNTWLSSFWGGQHSSTAVSLMLLLENRGLSSQNRTERRRFVLERKEQLHVVLQSYGKRFAAELEPPLAWWTVTPEKVLPSDVVESHRSTLNTPIGETSWTDGGLQLIVDHLDENELLVGMVLLNDFQENRSRATLGDLIDMVKKL